MNGWGIILKDMVAFSARRGCHFERFPLKFLSLFQVAHAPLYSNRK